MDPSSLRKYFLKESLFTIQHILAKHLLGAQMCKSLNRTNIVLALKELKFCREEIDNNQMSKIMSKVSKENKIGSSYWQVLGWGW